MIICLKMLKIQNKLKIIFIIYKLWNRWLIWLLLSKIRQWCMLLPEMRQGCSRKGWRWKCLLWRIPWGSSYLKQNESINKHKKDFCFHRFQHLSQSTEMLKPDIKIHVKFKLTLIIDIYINTLLFCNTWIEWFIEFWNNDLIVTYILSF